MRPEPLLEDDLRFACRKRWLPERWARLPVSALLLVGMGAEAFAEPVPSSASRPSASQPSASQPSASQPVVPVSSSAHVARARLTRALDLYISGRYGVAVAELRPLVERRVLEDRADHLEALKTYGIALYLHGASPAAERAFRALLRFDPGASLDRRFVRPEAVAYFERVRRRHRREMDALVARSAPQGSALINLLPPWGQFRNGHRTKAQVLLGVEAVSAVVSITTAVLLYSWRDEQGTFGERTSVAESLQRVNIVSFALLAGALAYGVVDGLYHYYRQRRARLRPLAQRLLLSTRF